MAKKFQAVGWMVMATCLRLISSRKRCPGRGNSYRSATVAGTPFANPRSRCRTSTVLTQSFSDWHSSQKYTHESVAVAMTYKLNANGSKHPATYNIYQYDIPIDATKQVSSPVLPKTSDIVLFTVALKP